ncbi:MAG: hypothetical protein UE295_06580 [Acutalibacteraceae bacterium]|nr:hypothetical protein [Acutalibacteraceae bacterium]
MSDNISWATSLNSFIYESPTNHFRWLVKKDGTKVLQQLYEVCENDTYKDEWRDVEEVFETENKE